MAEPKKGQLMQFMFALLDTSGSVLSGVTESDFNSGATKKFFGVNHGVSDTFTSGTISKTGRLVRSGVFQITLKGSENNYDEMMTRINKTGAKENIIMWQNTDNDDSDIMSAIALIQSLASDAHSAANQANSRVLLNQSRISDVQSYLIAMSAVQSDMYSLVSDFESNFGSRVPKEVSARSQLSDIGSDLRSYVIGISASVSDIISALSDAHSDILSAAQQTNSRVLLNLSRVSDIYSMLSDFQSDVLSRIPKEPAARSQLSDLASDIRSLVVGVSATVSDIYSLLSDVQSDFQSRVPKRVATDSQLSDVSSDLRSVLLALSGIVSDTHSAAVQANSRVLLIQSNASDIYSLLSDFQSDFGSRVPKEPAARSQLSDIGSDLRSFLVGMSASISDVISALSDAHSDLASKIGNITVTLTPSDVSDIGSAINAVIASTLSDTLSGVQQANSRLLVNQSRVSDIYSLLSDVQSDFQSRVPKRVATDSQLSSIGSDIISQIQAHDIGAGIGAREVVITVDDGADELENARVRVTNGAESYPATTDANGVAEFSLDDATWTVTITKFGYQFTPTTLVVNGDEAVTYSMDQIVPTPSPPGQVTGYLYCYDEEGTLEQGVSIYVKQIEPAAGSGVAYDGAVRVETSDSDGLVEFTGLFLGGRYHIYRERNDNRPVMFTVDDDADDPFELPSIVSRS